MDWNPVMTGIVEKESEGGRVKSFSLNGDPHANGMADAVGGLYGRLSARPAVSADHLMELAADRAKVSVLRRSAGAFGHSAILTMPGTVIEHGGQPALLPKGHRTKGFMLTPMLRDDQLLDIEPGYDGEEALTERVKAVRDRLPPVVRYQQSDLEVLKGKAQAIRLALFGTLAYPAGPIPGAIWLLNSYLSGSDIVEGVLIVPPGQAVSEPGSVRGSDLGRMQMGRVDGFGELLFEEALELCDAEYETALAAVTDRIG